MSQLWTTTADWLERRRKLDGRGIGFVPTMGALHRGHASLVERARKENEIVVASIFVNPTQFNDPTDLERYPRTLESDLALLETLGIDEVLAPSAKDLYPAGYRFRLELVESAPIMEAAYRPGFLAGALTVVLKLLSLVRPHRAYFGEKDYQQLRAVAEMAREFFMPTEIVPCPTVRAASGLAESSRNALLSTEAGEKAPCLHQVLTSATSTEEAQSRLRAAGFEVDYVEEHWGRRFAAAHLGGVRLIDNIELRKKR
jgi:pantoate--beta-alanine ligase